MNTVQTAGPADETVARNLHRALLDAEYRHDARAIRIITEKLERLTARRVGEQ